MSKVADYYLELEEIGAACFRIGPALGFVLVRFNYTGTGTPSIIVI
jgi:hypothetical protein